jgi:hypothetical protein
MYRFVREIFKYPLMASLRVDTSRVNNRIM